jgi:transcriptional regulator with XRE-family HTH domain
MSTIQALIDRLDEKGFAINSIQTPIEILDKKDELPHEEILIDTEAIYRMNNGVKPIHRAQYEEAIRTLDEDPSTPNAIQQVLELALPKKDSVTSSLPYLRYTPKTELGNLLLEERKKRGWTQTAAADKSGVDRREIGKIEKGDGKPANIVSINKLSVCYGINTKKVLKAYINDQVAYDRSFKIKQAPKDYSHTYVVKELPDEKPKIFKDETVPDLEATNELHQDISRDVVLSTILSILKNKTSKELCDISTALGYPVLPGKDDKYRINLIAHCPLCTKVIGTQDMTMYKTDPKIIDVMCPSCKESFSISYEAVLAMNSRKVTC